jgi:hypothetical protein
MTWFIVGVTVASFMALLLLISIICCIVYCCRNRRKVFADLADRESSADSSRVGVETPDTALRNPAHGKTIS